MTVRILVSRDGLLKMFDADGHAGADPRGGNLACASATTLLRTAARLCVARGMAVEGGAAARGAMRCVVQVRRDEDAGWLRGATDFLLRGLQDLREEFPGAVFVTVEMTEE